MKLLKGIKITRIEERGRDFWFDLGLRQLREGEVRFYRVGDFLTGDWLFKVCLDKISHKGTIRAIKCPPGKRFAQLEGDTMVFQRSNSPGWLYDVISLTYVDENNIVHRKIAKSKDEIPEAISESFEIRSYEEATGKKMPGKHFVTLIGEDDDKSMIILFLVERAWPISHMPPEFKLKSVDLLSLIKDLEVAKLEDVYRVAGEKMGLDRGQVDDLISSLEEKGEIRRPEPGFVKVVS